MSELIELSLAEARDGLEAKRFSASELVRAHISAVERARLLNAYVLETPENALAQASESEARIKRGEARPLEGLPIGVKDLFCTKGVRTTAGSAILGNFTPDYESTVTSHLWRDGAVMLGKLNCDEFAMGSSNETSAFGPVVSPWLPPNWDGARARASIVKAMAERNVPEGLLVPGGSSGGSAAAVAARLCLAATATDTGGSIRQPAAFTGTVGIKPTYGRCSRFGTVAFASSLDQAGPIARTVRDCAILLQAMAGPDPLEFDLGRNSGSRFRDGGIARRERAEDRHSEGISDAGHARGDRRALGRRRPLARRVRRGTRRRVAAAHRLRLAGLLYRGASGSVLEPRAL